MGIMYKLLVKHRNLRMDLMSAPEETISCTTPLTSATTTTTLMDTSSIDEDASSKETKFSAEHILQLCKFLAEKSKRNKELLQHQHAKARIFKHQRRKRIEEDDVQSSLLSSTCHQLREQQHQIQQTHTNAIGNFQSVEIERKQLSCWQTTATATTINENTASSAHIPSENSPPQPLLMEANQAALHASATPPTCTIDFQSSKRDILLKIRSQILERKRQRKMACVLMQQRIGGVWRPW